MSNYYHLSNKDRLKLLSRKEAISIKTYETPLFQSSLNDSASSTTESVRGKSESKVTSLPGLGMN